MKDLENCIKSYLSKLETIDRIFDKNEFAQLVGAEVCSDEKELEIGDILIKIFGSHYFVYQVMENGWQELATNRPKTPYFKSDFFKLI
tara:strand:- start:273 stop:536 length:264 start_codon:yes stop_codon:yes gene_type:complete